jgi:large subunit ribosomal protein L20
MTRSVVSTGTKSKHKKIFKLAKGYFGRAKNCYRVAIEKVEKALRYAYRDRRNRKRDFRSLWIQRINAAVREHGLVYSKFMGMLNKSGLEINTKMLSEIAISDKDAFGDIVKKAKELGDSK